ncbi:DDE domain protein [Brucella grignonensis]|uniref:DDE domain protein n=1 Tax=Brucella grignonensis TaxID=94627 RepID=A0A256F0T0_9HYPH|nr:DDE domain protein [Brucella grignonensis]
MVSIKGKKYWLWRSVDASEYVLDALLQSCRNKKAAFRLMRKLLKSQCVTPRVIIIDKLRSYAAAKGEVSPGVRYRSHEG